MAAASAGFARYLICTGTREEPFFVAEPGNRPGIAAGRLRGLSFDTAVDWARMPFC
jgi:hypothetical protein